MDFPTTRLSMVRAAAARGRDDALADWYQSYRPPLYAFVRRLGYGREQAEDLVQGFVTRMIEKNALQHYRQDRGRFRTFLLASLKHYLSNEHAAAVALKRGGGEKILGLEDAGAARDDLTPEKVFERRWAVDLLQRAILRVGDEYRRSDKGPLFTRLKPYLTGDSEGVPYREVAGELEMTEGAVKVAVHRLRERFHEALRAEVSETVNHPGEIGDEIRYLLAALSPP
jgi:RNA polymerase sigma-70 factor (ECF subfamily)